MNIPVVMAAGLIAASTFVAVSAEEVVRPSTFPVVPVRRVSSIPELIVSESVERGIPPDLTMRIAWEESHFNPLAERLEKNGTWSTGIFQINRGANRFHDLDVNRQIREGVAIAAHWWELTHDRKRTVLAYRRGHL